VAEGEERFGAGRFERECYASGWNGIVRRMGGSGRLHHIGRRVADGAICVRQPIGMKVRFLDGDAEEQENGTEKRKEQALTSIRTSVPPSPPHNL
jgi:hypothetical protein